MNISKHITYEEATRSDTARRRGIPNVPDETQAEAMQYVASMIFEPLRMHMGEPVRVSSFFRSPLLNKGIAGSSNTSQHMKGEAMDICRFADSQFRNSDLFSYILQNLDFDQLIWEHGTEKEPDWVHVSLKRMHNRKQVMRTYKQNGITRYKTMNCE